MKKIRPFLVLLAVLLAPGAYASDFSDVYVKHKDSVVTILAKTRRGVSQGTGFFITRHMIATNYHVIRGAKKIKYTVLAKKGFTPVEKIVLLSKRHDLAILYTDKIGPPLTLRSPRELTPGADIGVVGTPHGLEKTVTSGNFNNMRKMKKLGEVLQISAPVSSGNSGGPVFDTQGNVVGVATLASRNGRNTVAQNINFAVSADYLIEMLDKARRMDPSDHLALNSAFGQSEAEATAGVRAWVDKNGVFHASNTPPTKKEMESKGREEDVKKGPVSFMWEQ